MNCFAKRFTGALLVLLLGLSGVAWGQTTVFSDDFSTNQSTAWTTSGQIGSSNWYVNLSGVDWGARRNTGLPIFLWTRR